MSALLAEVEAMGYTVVGGRDRLVMVEHEVFPNWVSGWVPLNESGVADLRAQLVLYGHGEVEGGQRIRDAARRDQLQAELAALDARRLELVAAISEVSGE